MTGKRRRLWILVLWTMALVAFAWFFTAGAVWLNALRPTIPPSSPYEYSLRLRASVHLFAFPWFFALLVALWIALWFEERFATRFRKE